MSSEDVFKTSSRRFEDVFKTSSKRLQDLFKASSKRLQDVLIKTNMFALALCLQKTSSRCLGQDQYIRLSHMSSRRLQDVFKTSSRYLQDIFKTSCKGIFKMFSRRTIKLIVLFNTSSRSIQHFPLYIGICLGNTISEKFMVSVQNLQERDKKLSSFSFSPYYTFSWLLAEAYLEPGRTSTMTFFCEILNFLGSLKMVL